MDRVLYSQKIEQPSKKLKLTPKSRLPGYDFSFAIQNGDNDATIEVIEIIEKLPTILSD